VDSVEKEGCRAVGDGWEKQRDQERVQLQLIAYMAIQFKEIRQKFIEKLKFCKRFSIF